MITCNNTNWDVRSNRAEMKNTPMNQNFLGGELLQVKHTASPKFQIDKKLTIDVPLSYVNLNALLIKTVYIYATTY